MNTDVTDDLKTIYADDGVVCVRGAFNPDWLQLAERAIEDARAKPGPMFVDYSAETRPGNYCTDFWVWREVAAMRDFIFDSP